jgi:hypothetical protein
MVILCAGIRQSQLCSCVMQKQDGMFAVEVYIVWQSLHKRYNYLEEYLSFLL